MVTENQHKAVAEAIGTFKDAFKGVLTFVNAKGKCRSNKSMAKNCMMFQVRPVFSFWLRVSD